MGLVYGVITALAAVLAGLALWAGEIANAVTAALVAVAFLILLIRALRPVRPGETGGVFATVTLIDPGGTGEGTPVRITTHDAAWSALLDRAPQPDDAGIYGVPQRSWIWRTEAGEPEMVRLGPRRSGRSFPIRSFERL